MANSNSPHSKQQRIDTSAEWKKKNIIYRNYMINKSNPEDMENLAVFDEMEGKTIDKFRELFRVYKQYKNKGNKTE